MIFRLRDSYFMTLKADSTLKCSSADFCGPAYVVPPRGVGFCIILTDALLDEASLERPYILCLLGGHLLINFERKVSLLPSLTSRVLPNMIFKFIFLK